MFSRMISRLAFLKKANLYESKKEIKWAIKEQTEAVFLLVETSRTEEYENIYVFHCTQAKVHISMKNSMT